MDALSKHYSISTGQLLFCRILFFIMYYTDFEGFLGNSLTFTNPKTIFSF
jgi:hypothetical protein